MYDGEFLNWERIWSSFKNLDITNNIKDFQWKCLYNIVYTDSRLQTQALVARTPPPFFSNFLFTNLFSIKFLYYFISFSLF
jgi:hypothetical protein